MRRRRKSAQGESGFALLLVFLMAACIAIELYRELPRVAFESQRAKEQLLIQRGEQYKRAIQVFVRKNNRYPASIDELESYQNQRFLRRRYIDPMTGKDKWRVVKVGPGGVLIDSINNKQKGAPGSQEKKEANTFIGEGPIIGATQETQQANPARRRRASDTPGGMQGAMNPDGTMPGAVAGVVQPPGFPGQTPYPGQTGQYPGQVPYPGQTGQPGSPGQPQYPGQVPGQYPGQVQIPGQTGQAQYSGQAQYPGQTGQPYPGQVQYPGQTTPTQYPGQVQYPGQTPQQYTGTQPYVGGQPVQAGFQQGYPGQAVNPQTGASGYPYSTQPGAQGGMPGFPGGQPGRQAVPGGQAQNQAVQMIQQILTSPRPGGMPTSQGMGGMQIGGGIAGVASLSEEESIIVYNEHQKYNEWEFIYDISKDKGLAGARPGSGTIGTSASQMGQVPGQQPGQSSFGQSSFGQSSFGQSGTGQSGFGQSGFGQQAAPSGFSTGFGQQAPQMPPTQVQPQP